MAFNSDLLVHVKFGLKMTQIIATAIASFFYLRAIVKGAILFSGASGAMALKVAQVPTLPSTVHVY